VPFPSPAPSSISKSSSLAPSKHSCALSTEDSRLLLRAVGRLQVLALERPIIATVVVTGLVKLVDRLYDAHQHRRLS
jgi:hypothetical protein